MKQRAGLSRAGLERRVSSISTSPGHKPESQATHTARMTPGTELHDSCCRPDVEPDHDPTLADCCRRDLQEQKYIERVKQTLLEHDVTAVRSQLAHSAFVRDPSSAPAPEQDSDQDSLLTDDEGCDAGLSPLNVADSASSSRCIWVVQASSHSCAAGLGHAQAARMAQLKKEAAVPRSAQPGASQLTDIQAADLQVRLLCQEVHRGCMHGVACPHSSMCTAEVHRGGVRSRCCLPHLCCRLCGAPRTCLLWYLQCRLRLARTGTHVHACSTG